MNGKNILAMGAFGLIAAAGNANALTPTLEARSSFGSEYRWLTGSVSFDDVRLTNDGNLAFFGYDYNFFTYSGETNMWFGALGGVDTGTEIYESFSDSSGVTVSHGTTPNGNTLYFVKDPGFFSSTGEFRTYDGSTVTPGTTVFGGTDPDDIGVVGADTGGTIYHEVEGGSFGNDKLFTVSGGVATEIFDETDQGFTGFSASTDGYADNGQLSITGFGISKTVGVVDASGNFTEIGNEGDEFDTFLNTTRQSSDGKVALLGEQGGVDSIYVWDSGTLTAVVSDGDQGIDIGDIQAGADVNSSGNVIYTADTQAGFGGVEKLFFYNDATGLSEVLLAVGDIVFDPGLGQDLTVSDIGTTFAINDNNDVVVQVSFQGFGRGLVSFSSVPAPGAAGLMGLAGFAAMRRRR